MPDSADRDRFYTTTHGAFDSRSSDQPRPTEEENPFIAFRRYADQQVSSLLHSVIGLPSAFSTPPSTGWLYFEEADPARHTRQRRDTAEAVPRNLSDSQSSDQWRGSGGGWFSHHGARDDHSDRWWFENRRRIDREFPTSVFESPLDRLWPFEPSHFFSAFSPFASPFFLDSMVSANSPVWPIPYLLFSPYSPLHLEHQQNIRAQPHDNPLSSLFSSLIPSQDAQQPPVPRWRDAFEDLLRIENGKEMAHDGSRGNQKEHPKDWISGMISRGSLGDHWKQLQNNPEGFFNHVFRISPDNTTRVQRSGDSATAPFPENDHDRDHDPEEDKWLTELDLYDSFLHHVNESSDEESSMSPLLKLIVEAQRKHRREVQEEHREWKRAISDKDQKPPADEHQEGFDRPGPMTQTDSDIATHSKTSTQNLTPSTYLTSTITTTEKKTLPDGSIQTTVNRTKQFSDGSEESSETIHVENHNHTLLNNETTNPPDEPGTPEQTGDQDSLKKGGWFWKD
ncbi:hypothetical protein FQN50_000524 [Emmonsiellopsis sp. PD_5]|nr:hypothetical protein FQN50_000524 [Emmonsiellopsis sp. PD_5]